MRKLNLNNNSREYDMCGYLTNNELNSKQVPVGFIDDDLVLEKNLDDYEEDTFESYDMEDFEWAMAEDGCGYED